MRTQGVLLTLAVLVSLAGAVFGQLPPRFSQPLERAKQLSEAPIEETNQPGPPNFTQSTQTDQGPVRAVSSVNNTNPLDWQILNNPNGSPTVILLDRSRQVLAVYQIDSETGLINLKSVRKVSWDLQLEHFNTNKPTPEDLRAMNR